MKGCKIEAELDSSVTWIANLEQLSYADAAYAFISEWQ